MTGPGDLGRAVLRIPALAESLTLEVHDREELISSSLRADGIWERHETEFLIQRLRPGQVFVDVGANIGYYSLIASVCVGETGKVVALEPEAANYRLLARNVSSRRNVAAHRIGLAERDRDGPLYLSAGNFGDHRISPGGQSGVQPVVYRRGDTFLAGVGHIDFLKIDTQGSEALIVEGMLEVLAANHRHLDVVLEFWPDGLERSGRSAEALLADLERFHFRTFVINHVSGGVFPASPDDLLEFAATTMARPETREGFVNLFLTADPEFEATAAPPG